MEFVKYKSETRGLAEEIFDNFSENEIQILYSTLEKMGLHDWWKWKEEYSDLIIQYVNASPSQRLKTKKYINSMPLLSFAAYQHCMAGYEFICKAEELQFYIGSSYRDMAAQAGNSFKDLSNHYEHESWPWYGEDPLLKNT